MRYLCSLCWFLFLIAAWPMQAMAADPPVDAGSLLQQQRRLDEPSPATPTATPLTRPADSPSPATTADDGARVTVRGFRLELPPDAAISRERLDALLAPSVGQSLTLRDLRATVDRITALYRSEGWFLARAVLPPQDVTSGVLTVRVVEGRLASGGGVEVRPLSAAGVRRLDPGLAQRVVTLPLTPGAPLRLDALERSLQLLNEVPGVRASGNLEPGDEPGTTRLVVDVVEQPRLSGVLAANNYGTRYTDDERLSLQLALDNPSGRGDQLLALVGGGPAGGSRHAQLGYSVLARPDGLRLGVSASALQYRVGADLAATQARGDAKALRFQATQPLVRDRLMRLTALGSLEHKRLHDEALGVTTGEKRITVASVGLGIERSDDGAGGITWGDVSLAVGRLQLGAADAAAAPGATAPAARAPGTFVKINAGAQRQQPLHARLTLLGQMQVQLASRNLASAEKFQLGGPTGVRGYGNGEAAGDDGLRLTAEARWLALVRPSVGTLHVGVFGDWGHVRQWTDPAGTTALAPNHYRLASAGVGVIASGPRGLELRAQWARQIGDNPGRHPLTGLDADGRSRRSRVWVGVQMPF